MDRKDDATHDKCQTKHSDAGHYRLDLTEVASMSAEVVERTAASYRQQGYKADVLEHAPSIDFDLLSGKP